MSTSTATHPGSRHHLQDAAFVEGMREQARQRTISATIAEARRQDLSAALASPYGPVRRAAEQRLLALGVTPLPASPWDES